MCLMKDVNLTIIILLAQITFNQVYPFPVSQFPPIQIDREHLEHNLTEPLLHIHKKP